MLSLIEIEAAAEEREASINRVCNSWQLRQTSMPVQGEKKSERPPCLDQLSFS